MRCCQLPIQVVLYEIELEYLYLICCKYKERVFDNGKIQIDVSLSSSCDILYSYDKHVLLRNSVVHYNYEYAISNKHE